MWGLRSGVTDEEQAALRPERERERERDRERKRQRERERELADTDHHLHFAPTFFAYGLLARSTRNAHVQPPVVVPRARDAHADAETTSLLVCRSRHPSIVRPIVSQRGVTCSFPSSTKISRNTRGRKFAVAISSLSRNVNIWHSNSQEDCRWKRRFARELAAFCKRETRSSR